MILTRPDIAGTFGVVASTHWIASQSAMAVLERGGNAFDAAVAAGFVLQVAEPHLNGPGGDVPIIIHSAESGRQHVICGQGTAPAAASIEAFEGLGLGMIPGTGLLPAVVPGSFDAWCLLLRDFGTMEFADVVSYAMGYAANGIHLVPRVSASIASVRPLFEREWPTSAEVFLPGGKVPAARSLFRRPALARTWEALAAAGTGPSRERRIDAVRKAWSEGFVAEAVDRFYREARLLDTSGERHGGFLRGEDMAGWEATIEAPLTLDYAGRYTVLKCGPWSQGPVFLEQLSLLAGFDLGAMDPLGADFVHTVVECAKLAYADREAFYGDPDFVDVPMETLLSKAYADARRALFGETASLELRPGTVPGYDNTIDLGTPGESIEIDALWAGEPTLANLPKFAEQRGDTCHVDVIDRWGNMVSATPSGGWLQSSPVVPELGFPITTRGQMFTLKKGQPNALAPKKRPRTTLTPSFALRDGEPWMAFGTPGGDQQDQWSLIFFLRRVHHGMTSQESIDAPSFHSEHWPSSFWPREAHPGKVVLEERFGADVAKRLSDRGHSVQMGPPWSEGRLSAASREADGQMYAAANPRGEQGYAVGR